MKNMQKIGISLAVLMAGAGGWWYLDSCPEQNNCCPKETENTPTISVSQDVPSPVSSPGQKNKDILAYEKNYLFDQEFASFLIAIEQKAGDSRIAWKGYLSADPKLPKEQIEQNTKMWTKFLDLLKYYHELEIVPLARLRFYSMLFDIPSFKPTEEDLKLLPRSDEWDVVPFAYITEVITPSWYVLNGNCNPNYKTHDDPNFRATVPKHLLPIYDDRSQDRIPPSRGIDHLQGYDKLRAENFGGESIKAWRQEFGDIKGKDLLDLGTGCGFTIPLFREALGDKSKIYCGELDKYTLDVLQFTTQDYNVQVFQCKEDDCCMPENSVDIINMTGVHFGEFCGMRENDDHLKAKLFRWMKSMHKALRPNGVLVINDGSFDLLEKGLKEFVELGGFKLAEYREAPDRSTFTLLYRKK